MHASSIVLLRDKRVDMIPHVKNLIVFTKKLVIARCSRRFKGMKTRLSIAVTKRS